MWDVTTRIRTTVPAHVQDRRLGSPNCLRQVGGLDIFHLRLGVAPLTISALGDDLVGRVTTSGSQHAHNQVDLRDRDRSGTGAWRSLGDRGLVQPPRAPNRGRNPSIRAQYGRDRLQLVCRLSRGEGDRPNQPHANDGPGPLDRHSKPSALTAGIGVDVIRMPLGWRADLRSCNFSDRPFITISAYFLGPPPSF